MCVLAVPLKTRKQETKQWLDAAKSSSSLFKLLIRLATIIFAKCGSLLPWKSRRHPALLEQQSCEHSGGECRERIPMSDQCYPPNINRLDLPSSHIRCMRVAYVYYRHFTYWNPITQAHRDLPSMTLCVLLESPASKRIET